MLSDKMCAILAVVFGLAIGFIAGFLHWTMIQVLEHFRPWAFDDLDRLMNWVCTVIFGLGVGFFSWIYIRVKWEQARSRA